MRTRLVLLAAALVAFGASLGSGFHFDDYSIFADPSITSADGWIGVWSVRQTRPLTQLTLWLNYQIGGGDPLGYHLLNLLLHLGAVLLAYECLRRLIPETAAAVGAGLFALHPIQAEAVDYVWARGILLAAIFCLLALREWIGGRPWAALGWFAVALLAKEEVAAFPLALLVLPVKRRAGPMAAMLALSLAASARVIYAAAGWHAGISPARYLLAEGGAILRYLRLVIVPYGFTVDPDLRVPTLWLGLLAWVAIAAIAYGAWRYSRWTLAGLILLIPSSTVFPAADLAADRRMYLAMFCFGAALALALARYGKVAFAPVAVCLVLSFLRTQVWMSDRALWTEAVERAPEKIRPKIQLARALPAAQGLELLSRAREMAPNDAEVADETGKILLSEGQADGALAEFGRALALDPRNALYVNDRGVALAALGQTDAARGDFQHALELDPSLAEARRNLAKLPPAR